MGEGLFSALMLLGGQDYQSSECTSQMTFSPPVDPSLKALQLTEALRAVLEGQGSEEKRDSLRKQVSTDTAHVILKWLEKDEVSTVLFTSEGPKHSGEMDGLQTRTALYHIQHAYPTPNLTNPIDVIIIKTKTDIQIN